MKVSIGHRSQKGGQSHANAPAWKSGQTSRSPSHPRHFLGLSCQTRAFDTQHTSHVYSQGSCAGLLTNLDHLLVPRIGNKEMDGTESDGQRTASDGCSQLLSSNWTRFPLLTVDCCHLVLQRTMLLLCSEVEIRSHRNCSTLLSSSLTIKTGVGVPAWGVRSLRLTPDTNQKASRVFTGRASSWDSTPGRTMVVDNWDHSESLLTNRLGPRILFDIQQLCFCFLLGKKFTVSVLLCHKNELNLYPLVQTTIDRVVT